MVREKRVAPKRRTPVVQMTLPTELLHAIEAWAAAESVRRHGARITRSQAVRELCVAALEAQAALEPSRRVRMLRMDEEPMIDPEVAA